MGLMEEASRYYTPSVEEFHVGFEFEYSNKECGGNDWKHSIVTAEFLRVQYIFGELRDNVRVKYLDKEDIESLGWKISKEFSAKQIYQSEIIDLKEYEYWFEMDKYLLSKWIKICLWKSKNNMSAEKTIFEGIVKNKSELKVLMKQLAINV
jgi:hypothetical protein